MLKLKYFFLSLFKTKMMMKYNTKACHTLISNAKYEEKSSPQPKHMNNGETDEKRETFVSFYKHENVDIEMGLKSGDNYIEITASTLSIQPIHSDRIRV